MHITNSMSKNLERIIHTDPSLYELIGRGRCSPDELGQHLIEVYQDSESLYLRKMILEFMQAAGYSWLRRLFLRNSEFDEQFCDQEEVEEIETNAPACNKSLEFAFKWGMTCNADGTSNIH